MRKRHSEHHRLNNVGWLRAAVLGANDGIVSTASLLLGVAASGAGSGAILTAGFAGLVAGAMSMAAGEYVSVSSQADAERADLEVERRELANDPVFEHEEMAAIYRERGLEAGLASEVASQLMAFDALGAHARDELGITDLAKARPLQAAAASAAAFSAGAALPLVVAWLSPPTLQLPSIGLASLVTLCLLGAVAAQAGGAPRLRAALRVGIWGMAAMALTTAVGHLFGVAA